MDLGIAGKPALVTASSAGIGRGAALALSREGCRVTICARDPERLAATAAELPGDTLAVPIDLTDPDAPRRLVEATVERFGGLEILVANVGGPPVARALEVTDDTMHAAVDAVLLTAIRLVRESLPHMRAVGWGRIVLVTSTAAKQPIPNLAYSNTTRAGLFGWAKTAAQDLLDDDITLNLVCPGLHDTGRVGELELEGRLGDPEDLGAVIAFLCSEQARFVSGTAVMVDGAATLGLT